MTTAGMAAGLRPSTAIAALTVAAILAYGLGAADPYGLRVLTIAGVYVLNVVGYQFIFGHAGALSLAQGTFFGIGAYATALLSLHAGLDFAATFPVSILAATLLALVIAVPVLRLETHYLALATLAISQVAILVATNWESLTGGANGLPSVPGIVLFGQALGRGLPTFVAVWTCVAIGVGVAAAILTRGRRLRFHLQREQPLAAAAVGLDRFRLRLGALLLSAAYGGAAGALYVHTNRVISPDALAFSILVLTLAMTVIGGRLSLAGALVAAPLLSLIPEWFRFLDRWYLLAYGAAMLAVVVFAPDGLAALAGRRARRGARPPAPPARHVPPVAPEGLAPPDTKTALPGLDPGIHAVAAGPWHRLLAAMGRLRLLGPSRRSRSSAWIRGSSPRKAQEGGHGDHASPPRPAGATEPALSLSELRKGFGGLVAVDIYRLDIPAGQICGLIGPNGSGKTTLLNLVSGFERPDAGRIAAFGTDIAPAPAHSRTRHGIARCFQQPMLLGTRTAAENVAAGVTAAGGARAAEAEATRWLARCGIGDEAGRRIDALSFGHRRLVELARALAGAPRLVLLDEPAAGLDGDDLDRLAGLIQQARSEGTTWLVVDHNFGFLAGLADRLVCLDAGAPIADGAPEQVLADPAVRRAYFGAGRSAETRP